MVSCITWFSQVQLAGAACDDAKAALEREPRNDFAHHLMGRWHFGTHSDFAHHLRAAGILVRTLTLHTTLWAAGILLFTLTLHTTLWAAGILVRSVLALYVPRRHFVKQCVPRRQLGTQCVGSVCAHKGVHHHIGLFLRLARPKAQGFLSCQASFSKLSG